jgi:hypothetical protein
MSGRRLLLASAARTATATSIALRNRWHKGLHVVLVVTAASGSGGLTVHIQQVDRDSGNTVDLLVAGAAVTAIGTYAYQLAPGEGAAASGILVAVGRQLPTDWQVSVVAGDASSYTYQLNGLLLD